MRRAFHTVSDPRRAGGFSLLEIVLVLALGMLLVGGALGMMYYSSDQRQLRMAMAEIETMARRARATAALQQTPYALVFSAQGVEMMPLAEALLTPEIREERGAAAGTRFEPKHASWSPNGDMRLWVRRWATDQWLPAEGRAQHLWRFDPEGICEPIGIRLAVDKGYAELEAQPLTAALEVLDFEAN